MNIDTDAAWRAVMKRDRAAEGRFVYAVRTTGVYCRPTCPSRRPARGNVEFHADGAAARAAGFRACKRCHPDAAAATSGEAAVGAAIRYLEAHADERVTLPRLASAVGVSPAHLQRTFKRAVGVSPKAYHDALRSDRFRAELRHGTSVTAAVYAAGYGASSRAYAEAHRHLGMTPGQYRSGGRGVAIRYTILDSPIGRLLVAVSGTGVCSVAIADDDAALREELEREFAAAKLEAVAAEQLPVAREVLGLLGGGPTLDIPVDLHGTAFERRVWQAIREIPRGETRSYGEVAAALGQPTAARAVARACAANRVALVVPCHRVTRSDGDPGGFRWGAELKRRLVASERDR